MQGICEDERMLSEDRDASARPRHAAKERTVDSVQRPPPFNTHTIAHGTLSRPSALHSTCGHSEAVSPSIGATHSPQY